MGSGQRKGSSPKSVPAGLSRDQEARFWDEHDLADFFARTERVKVKIARSFAERVRQAVRNRRIPRVPRG